MKFKILLLFVLICVNSWLHSITWEIKQDGTGNFTTIQEGIDESADADTVLVYPGTYYENINYNGKNITVASLYIITGNEQYINQTIVDGNQNGSVVVFQNNETNEALLMGFTIQNGSGYEYTTYQEYGGGIFINFSSPTLRKLIIMNNMASIGGGILFSSTDAIIESVNILNNHAYGLGGGFLICRVTPDPINSNVTFSANDRCNIYNNTAGFAADIFIAENHTPVTEVFVDTFTVLDPGWDYISQFPNMDLYIENDWLQPVEADLYVNPNGDDSNSGLTESDPLKTIQWALSKIKADSLHPRNIYLAEGIYSPATNGELFALNMRAYVNLIGSGMDMTILEYPYDGSSFIVSYPEDKQFSISDCTFQNREARLFDVETIRLEDCDFKISNVKIVNCESSLRSALSCGNVNIEIENLIVINNNGFGTISIHNEGNDDNSVIINNLIFIENDQYEPSCGGGSLIVTSENVSITNSLFAQNHSYDNIWPTATLYLLGNDTLNFYNNVVVNNSTNGGALKVGNGGNINIKNSIIYGNSTHEFLTCRADIPTYVNISNSLIEGGTDPSILHIAGVGAYGVEFNWGEGIIDAAPQFIGGNDIYDPLYYQLSQDSPCVDAGTLDTLGLFLPPWDLLHNYRVWDGDGNGSETIDMGCYEYGADEYPVGITNDEVPITNNELRNYPNPFYPSDAGRSSSTTIQFSTNNEQGKHVELAIYNIKGQKVKTLINSYMTINSGEIIWEGKDKAGKSVSSGVYLLIMKEDGQIAAKRKMMLLK